MESRDQADLAEIADHGRAFDELHTWLLGQFHSVHGEDLNAVNALITQLHERFARLDGSRAAQRAAPAPAPGGRTWDRVELVLVDEIRSAEKDGREAVIYDTRRACGVAEHGLWRVVERLIDADYVQATTSPTLGPRLPAIRFARLTERGARAVGMWPCDGPVADLIALLEARLLAAPPEEKRRLQMLLDALLGVGNEVGQALLTDLVRSAAGRAV